MRLLFVYGVASLGHAEDSEPSPPIPFAVYVLTNEIPKWIAGGRGQPRLSTSARDWIANKLTGDNPKVRSPNRRYSLGWMRTDKQAVLVGTVTVL